MKHETFKGVTEFIFPATVQYCMLGIAKLIGFWASVYQFQTLPMGKPFGMYS